MTHGNAGPLGGVRVLDLGTVIAGPGVAARLSDFGADVIKIEHPTGDPTRSMGWMSNGEALWWKVIGRNKRPVTLDLSKPEGAELLLRLAETADVLVESFRPGTLEKWGVGPERLLERNPRLVVLRVSAFGQTGPSAPRPGFGTLAESMSGYAHMSGSPDGPPLLPPVALADEVSALLGSFAVMVALYHRDAAGGGKGQVIDLSLFESLFGVTGPVAAVYDRLGLVQDRIGSGIPYAAPRGTYPTNDGRWIGLAGTTQSIAERVFAAIGRPELLDDPRFATPAARVEHRPELNALITAWTSARSLSEAMEEFERNGAAAAPILDIEQILADPQYAARRTIVRVPDETDGDSVLMADAQPRLSATPGRIRHAGRAKGSANAEVYGELGLTERDLADLAARGVV